MRLISCKFGQEHGNLTKLNGTDNLFSSPGPKGHRVKFIPKRPACVMRCATVRSALCVVRQQLKTIYSNIFFYKTTGPTVFKFHMQHNLIPRSQNGKGSVENPRWSPLLKIT